MPEIELPTAVKQDSIKQTVENIASNFPLNVSGGTDFLSGIGIRTSVGSHQSSVALEITGKGILVSASANSIILSYQIDDGAIYSTLVGAPSPQLFFAPFNEKVKVTASSVGAQIQYILF